MILFCRQTALAKTNVKKLREDLEKMKGNKPQKQKLRHG